MSLFKNAGFLYIYIYFKKIYSPYILRIYLVVCSAARVRVIHTAGWWLLN